MASYTVGEAAELLGVSADTVRRWADGGRLATSRSSGGRRQIEGPALAHLAQSLAEEAPASSTRLIGSESARNRFTGIVTSVTKDTVMAQVDIHAGPHRIVSLMSREAADELQLAPGSLVVASIKATNVVVELPASS
jgi:molybdopterin-binding protein